MRLNQVTVTVKDIDEAIGFYRTLGLRLIVHSPHYARFECPDDESTFSIHLDASFGGSSATVVYFEHDALDGLVETLKARGLVFESGPMDQSWLWREAYLRDPSGNRICLFQAGEARRYPPWRVREQN